MGDFLVKSKDLTMSKAQYKLLCRLKGGATLVKLPSGRVRLYERGQGEGVNRPPTHLVEEGWLEASEDALARTQYKLTRAGADILRTVDEIANLRGQRIQRQRQRQQLYA